VYLMTRGQGAKRLGIFLQCVSPLLADFVAKVRD
jgi:hypothetical protein